MHKRTDFLVIYTCCEYFTAKVRQIGPVFLMTPPAYLGRQGGKESSTFQYTEGLFGKASVSFICLSSFLNLFLFFCCSPPAQLFLVYLWYVFISGLLLSQPTLPPPFRASDFTFLQLVSSLQQINFMPLFCDKRNFFYVVVVTYCLLIRWLIRKKLTEKKVLFYRQNHLLK